MPAPRVHCTHLVIHALCFLAGGAKPALVWPGPLEPGKALH